MNEDFRNPATESPAPDPSRPLWAPWRIEYFKHKEKEKGRCFLCENTRDDAEERHLVIVRGIHAYLILNGYPYNSGHVLAAPNRHVGDLLDLEEEERAELFDLAMRMKRVMMDCMHPDGFNFGFNLGEAAGAGLQEHVHGHLVPRWSGDTNFMPVLADVRVVPQALEQTAHMLRKNWRRVYGSEAGAVVAD